MTIVLATPPYLEFYDNNGAPLSGGLVYTYTAGTLTPKATYTDQGGLTQQTNPIVLDSAGRAVWWIEGSYKYIVKDSLGNTIRTVDNVTSFSNDSGLSLLGQIAANTIIGNNTGSTATPIALTVSEVQAMLGTFQSSFRNVVINGGFSVWNRATTYALTTSVVYGSADRWATAMFSSAAGIANRDTSVPADTGLRYSMKIGRTAASSLTSAIAMYCALTTENSVPLQGKQVTLSFYGKAGANLSASSITAKLASGKGTDQSVTLVGSWTSEASQIAQAAALTTSWQRFQYTVTLPSDITQLYLQFSYIPTGTAGADDNMYITGVQLERGSVATAFEFRNFEIERDLCSYYYEKSFSYATAPAQNSTTTGAITVLLPTGATGTFGQSIVMKPKRVAPTITTYNTSAANANWRDTTNSADRVVTVGTIGESSFSISGAAGVAASTNRIQWAADAEL